MARARLHIICGNCGCNDIFTWQYERDAKDMGDGTFQPSVYLSCGNCATLHDLDDNAKPDRKQLAAAPQAERFCDGHCSWRDHHPDCEIGKAEKPGGES